MKSLSISKSVKKQLDLKGKTALINGGGGFLGVQFAEAICEMNGNVILVDKKKLSLHSSKEKLAKKKFNNFSTIQLDITNEKECLEKYNQIWTDNTSIDILINSAALTKSGIDNLKGDFYAKFENSNQDIWNEGINVNLTATQIACKIIGSKMADIRKGSIINIASDIGVISPNQNIYEADKYGYPGVEFNSPAFYAVSKAGVIHLTKYLAAYWGRKNVRVNSISPAGVYRNHSKGFVQKLSEQIPMGRMAMPNEFKGAIIFLASDASSFVTGHNLLIDGGRTIW